jgi:hypothetical protein
MQQFCCSAQLSVYPVGDETELFVTPIFCLFSPLCSLLLFFRNAIRCPVVLMSFSNRFFVRMIYHVCCSVSSDLVVSGAAVFVFVTFSAHLYASVRLLRGESRRLAVPRRGDSQFLVFVELSYLAPLW